jgi:amidase
LKVFGDHCTGELAREAFVGIQALSEAMAAFFQQYDVLLTPTVSRPPVAHHAFVPKGIAALVTRLLAAGWFGFLLKPPRSIDNIVKDGQFRFYTFTPLGSAAGLPSANVPLYWNAEGLPIGTLFTAAHGQDGLLFRLAAQLEEARPWRDRRPPLLDRAPAPQ